ncbi:MAG: hypothetical protein [Caudoviricetes sp.]|nr:MAG: hypothetical protein [Caudoviricetes sp.]
MAHNNNPNNIRKSKDQWQGLTGEKGGFVTFDTPEAGTRAAIKNMMTQASRGEDTLAKLITKLSPPNENETASYINFVSSKTGIKPDDKIDWKNPQKVADLMKWVTIQEHGQKVYDKYYGDDVIWEGVNAGLENRPVKSNGTINEVLSPSGVPDGIASRQEQIDVIKTNAENKAASMTPSYFGDPSLNFENKHSIDTPLASQSSVTANSSDFGKEKPKDVGLFEGTGENLAHRFQTSTLARMVTSDSFEEALSLITPRDAVPLENLRTPSQMEMLKTSQLPSTYWQPLMSAPKDQFEPMLERQQSLYKEDQRLAKDTGMGAQMTGWLGDLIGDPLTYVGGAAGKLAFKGQTGYEIAKGLLRTGAYGGTLGVVSEGIRTNVVGGEAHYAENFVGGALLAPALGSLGTLFGERFGKDALRYQHSIDQQAKGSSNQLPPNSPKTDGTDLGGVNVQDLGDGSVRMPDGTVLSASSPLNPLNAKHVEELEGLTGWTRLGGFSELGNVVNDSKLAQVNAIGSDLLRPTVLRKDGSGGKKGTTAEDTQLFLGSNDNIRLEEQIKLANRAKGQYGGDKEKMWREVVEAIETKQIDKLSGASRDLAESVNQHMELKAYYAENPNILGQNPNARPLMTIDKTRGAYVPVRYDQVRVSEFKARFDSLEDAQEVVARHMMQNYEQNTTIRSFIDKQIADGDYVDVRDYAYRKAYGIVEDDSRLVNTGDTMTESFAPTSGAVVEPNSYLLARHGFDMNYQSTLPDGSTFSLNDLRSFDMDTMIPSYHRRINGDVAIMASRGQTAQELAAEIGGLRGAHKGDNRIMRDIDALEQAVKVLTGSARREPPSKGETLARSLTDLSLFAKGAYMAVQNYTEGAALLTNGATKMLLNKLPVLKQLASSKRISNEVLNEWHNIGWGKELSNAIRMTRGDYIEGLARSNRGAGMPTFADKAVGSLKYATQELVQRSPHIKAIPWTTNHLMEAARFKMIADIGEAAHGGKLAKRLKDNYLNYAGVSPEQYDSIISMVKGFTSLENGAIQWAKNVNPKDMIKDPRFMDMYRLVSTAAEDVTLRNHRSGFANTEAFGGYMSLLTQFRMFTVKSLNGRFRRMMANGKINEQKLDMAYQAMASVMLAGGFQLALNQIKGSQIQDEQKRRIYLEKMNDPAMVGWAALTRSSVTGAPLSLGQWLVTPTPLGDAFANMRTTASPQEYTGADSRFGSDDNWSLSAAAARTINQLPAINTGDSLLGVGQNLGASLLNDSYSQSFGLVSGMMSNAQQLVPNDPVTQRLMAEITEYLQGTDLAK